MKEDSGPEIHQITPDLRVATQFLTLLDPEADRFHFQTLADEKRPVLPRREANQRTGLTRPIEGS